jgi:MFS transporter, DHA1 family, multidrug resistance protein
LNKNDASLPLTVLLGMLTALPALGTDLYLPALPDVARSFAVPVSAAQLTLTTYFVGLALGMFAWGPLSDRFGRKPMLIAGLALMLAVSAIGAFAESIATLSAVRLVQGFAMTSGASIGRAIVRDLHAHEQAARLLARMAVVFSIVPIAAPLAGALLTGVGGWPSIFVAMAAVGAVLLLALLPLAETAPAERRSARPGAIVRTFAAIITDRRFLAPFSLILCAQVGILAWVSSSSFTLVRGLGVSVTAFSLMFALVMLGQICGAWSSSRLVLRLGIRRLLSIGAALMFAAGGSAALLAWLGVGHWLAVVLPFMAFLFGTAVIMPNAIAAALSPFPQSAGSATSLIGAIGFGSGALISTVLGALFDGTARPMATTAGLAGVGALLAHRLLLHGKA